jgi:RHH-type proline utilization regulon transcriptional repressor/proline dehydrogenase/delta 1-pyrroline-5-carboxylate dehydrogenase
MYLRGQASPAGMGSIAAEAVDTVERWLSVTDVKVPPAESKLARLLSDEEGARFVTDIVDLVIRPGDVAVAARNLEHLSRRLPARVNWLEGVAAHLAGGFAPLLPSAIVPIARESFLRPVGHLLLRGDSEEIEKQVAKVSEPGGIRPTVAPLTAVASGHRERNRQVADAHELLRRPGIDAVSLRPASFAGRPRLIDLDAEVESATELLEPLYETAAHAERAKFINLDVARLEELELSLRVFERTMARFPQLDMGISLPACLPESLPALVRVIDLARKRCAAGGAGITVRFTRGERLAQERAHADIHGWPSAPFATRGETDAHYVRLLDYAFTPDRTSVVRVVSATHNLFTVALAWRLARARGVERSLEHEFMLGIATEQRETVKRDVGGVRLFTPVVQNAQVSLAVPYLKRRIFDLSRADGYLATFLQRGDGEAFSNERDSFLSSVERSAVVPVATNRTQTSVRTEVADFTVESTREWASAVLERTRDSASGESLLARSMIGTEQELEQLVTNAVAHGESWGGRRGSTRAAVLESVAEVFAQWRGLLVETAVSESGVTLPEADTDVTVAIELARRAAEGARELDRVRDASCFPPRLVVVVSSRSVPLSALADDVLSALGAGSAVIIKTAPETRRSSAVFIETLIAGGVPPGLVTILDDEEEFARALISDERVDHVLHTGSRHAAKLFHSWRAESRISSTTGGRNSVIVTASAHLETAVTGIVDGALEYAGQSPLAVSTVIFVGNAGDSARFLGRLSDAIASMPIAAPGTTGAGMSSLARPATVQQRLSLETLDDGESWRVQPRQVDAQGRLWTPGLRDNVSPDSRFRKGENRAPVVGIVRADTLADAIDIQNAHRFGLSAGIYSFDDDEVGTWLDSAEAGLLSVNCSPGFALRGRAPVQGWNRAVVGTVSSGGYDTVLTLGRWQPVGFEPGTTVTLEGISEPVAQVIGAAQSGMDFTEFDWVRTGARSDEEAWGTAYATKKLVQTESERIEHRYRPVPVTIRLSEGAPMVHLVRVLAAATRTQSAIAISSALPLHSDLIALFRQWESPAGVAEVLVESDVRWRARVQAGEIATSRIRLIGGDRNILARVLHGQLGIAVHDAPVTASGRIELLPFLRGQTVCIGSENEGITRENRPQPNPTYNGLPPPLGGPTFH